MCAPNYKDAEMQTHLCGWPNIVAVAFVETFSGCQANLCVPEDMVESLIRYLFSPHASFFSEARSGPSLPEMAQYY